METTRTENLREIRTRARHHARRLIPLVDIGSDIFANGARFTPLKTRLRIRTQEGRTYIIRGWYQRGRGYVGIEVKRYGSPEVHRLRLVENGRI